MSRQTILNDDHCACLDLCLENCLALKEQIASNERAGIPMPAELREVQEQEELAAKLKRENFPMRS
jgi:hypothetical protein